ncbi:MAG: TIM-barrel domain-containing protein [Anaerolineales bacterium]
MAMKVVDLLRGLRSTGVANITATVRYALARDRANARLLKANRPAEPIAPAGFTAVVPCGNGACFTFEHAQLDVVFLAPDVIRCSWSPGIPPVPYAIDDRTWPGDDVQLIERDGTWTVSGSRYHLEVKPSGSLEYRTASGHPLREEQPPQLAGSSWSLQSNLSREAVVMGLGERAAGLDLRGKRYRFWNLDPSGGYGADHDPLYLSIPVYFVLQHAGSYLLFHENAHDGWIEFQEAIHVQFDAGLLRTYFIPGEAGHALSRFSDLTGRAPLPPRWALGYHQSRWGYRSASEIRELVNHFRQHNLPLAAVHLDLDYMDGKRIFTVDEDQFPQLGTLADDLLEQDIRLVTIIDPGVKVERGYSVYTDGQERDVFCRRQDERVQYAPVWPGWCAFPDFSSPEARTWWGEQYPRLLEEGIAGIWHDMNEPAVFSAWGELTLPLDTQHALEGQRGDHRSAHNLYGLLMNRAGYEALHALRPDRRPFLLTRSGWAGVQRYAWAWTGDTESSWEMLARTIGTLLGMGMSGLPFVGSDIGGFSGRPDAELYLRWLQLAAFTPFFRTHSALGTERREPWSFDEATLDVARKTLALRQRLTPYLYTQAWLSSTLGLPMMRPLFWANPRDEKLWPIQDQFMLGDALLVAPVLQSGAVERTIYLPDGAWIDLQTGRSYTGPGEVTVGIELDHIPVLVRAGTALPMSEAGKLLLVLYLPGPEGEAGLLYHDAGDGYGSYRLERYHLTIDGAKVGLHSQVKGDFPAPEDRGLELVGVKAAQVLADGVPVQGGPQHFLLKTFQELQIQPA